MQTLDRPGRYLARWGTYSVILDNNGRGRCLAEVRHTDDQSLVAATGDVPQLTWREAIEWSAGQLAALGCSAFIDGKSRSLVDLLAFERVEDAKQDSE